MAKSARPVSVRQQPPLRCFTLTERALKAQSCSRKSPDIWQSTLPLSRYCRVRSYLVSAHNHGIRDAIHAALTSKPWLPTPATA